jgi:hypothetical protein
VASAAAAAFEPVLLPRLTLLRGQDEELRCVYIVCICVSGCGRMG